MQAIEVLGTDGGQGGIVVRLPVRTGPGDTEAIGRGSPRLALDLGQTERRMQEKEQGNQEECQRTMGYPHQRLLPAARRRSLASEKPGACLGDWGHTLLLSPGPERVEDRAWRRVI